jgi:hypothetical protein
MGFPIEYRQGGCLKTFLLLQISSNHEQDERIEKRKKRTEGDSVSIIA